MHILLSLLFTGITLYVITIGITVALIWVNSVLDKLAPKLKPMQEFLTKRRF